MLYYLSDDPIWILVIGLIAFAILVIRFVQTGLATFIIAAIGSLLLTGAFVALEYTWVTETEQVIEAVDNLGVAAVADDYKTIEKLVSKQSPKLTYIKMAMSLYRIKLVNFTDKTVTFNELMDPREAVVSSQIFAKGGMKTEQIPGDYPVKYRMKIIMHQTGENGAWVLYDWEVKDANGNQRHCHLDHKLFQRTLFVMEAIQ